LAWLLLLLAATLVLYVFYAMAGMRAAAQVSGTLHEPALLAPVSIVRDARDIPHIIAANQHDLMFAQGYVEASDRLFQMDLVRRYETGRLSEVLGKAVLPADERARIVPVRQIVDAQWNVLPARERMLLQSFSDGVNAAIREQPLPPEFRILLYKPERWTPRDSLAVSFSTVLDLIDSWDDVIRRDRVARAAPIPVEDLYTITDPVYDAPVTGAPASVPPLPNRTAAAGTAAARVPYADEGTQASNEWASGAAHSSSGHALLANDPHLRVSIPGVWYLVDLRAPGFHAAGGSLPGTPGVILGHNDRIAWGATNGTVVTDVVYRDTLVGAERRMETFHVRFGADVRQTYYATRHGFVVQTDGTSAYAVDWNAVRMPRSPISAFSALDRAQSIAQAMNALRSYPGPPQNFAIADNSGAVAYHLAGLIPRDPDWGLRVHKTQDPRYPFIPFDQLPHVDASRGALVFTANNRMYGSGYPYRLSANFAAPYRAHRIQQFLRPKRRLGIADFAAMQLDTYSAPEFELARETVAAVRRMHLTNDPALARYAAALQSWNGRFDPGSRGASAAFTLRRSAVALLDAHVPDGADYSASANSADVMLLLRVLRERPWGWYADGRDYDRLLVDALRQAVAANAPAMLQPWRAAGSVQVNHALGGLGISFLNGGTLPGDGDAYSLRVVSRPEHGQSFRAVWDTGNWDAGGIVIPSGESGEPGSGHYTDLRETWVNGTLVPLPFSERAVRDSSAAILTLTPR
jgi:penicillin amidase